jgi:hypothetical protein
MSQDTRDFIVMWVGTCIGMAIMVLAIAVAEYLTK